MLTRGASRDKHIIYEISSVPAITKNKLPEVLLVFEEKEKHHAGRDGDGIGKRVEIQ